MTVHTEGGRRPGRIGAADIRVSAASDVGARRAINEDSFFASAPVFLVADGMGGHAHGDQASQAVARTFGELIPSGSPTTSAAILAAIVASNLAVRLLSDASASYLAVAGTTLAGVAFVETEGQSGSHWMVFNVGDSRVYSWDGTTLKQLTVDHSAVQELIDAGEITADAALYHRDRNVVTRALGVDEEVEPDVWLLPVGGRQSFLMCSDGLTKELTDDEIASVLFDNRGDTTFDVAAALVQAAIDAGGADNITVVLVESEWEAALRADELAGTVPAFLEETRPRA